jgi:hypothetical protein
MLQHELRIDVMCPVILNIIQVKVLAQVGEGTLV